MPARLPASLALTLPLGVGLLLTSACGGGGSGEAAAPAPEPPASSTPQTPSTPAPAPAPAPAGLDARPANASCLAPERPSVAGLATRRVFPNLSFRAPVGLLQAPGDARRWFVLEQAGAIRSFANDPQVATTSTLLDITARVTSGGETGLLGLAFHPRWPQDPRAYVSYTTGGEGALVSHISEFRTADGGATLDPASERVLITLRQPEANHNGGNIAFGPDGLLYIGFGDGGGAGDVHGDIGNGQSLGTLLGKILRIDVDKPPPTGLGYSIPANNPFAADGGACSQGSNPGGPPRCAEIYAYGLRNPWRFSFDRVGGTLWVADVGQGDWEEIDRVVAGGNYGWRCREGAHSFNAACGNPQNLIDPVAEYAHTEGDSITGGYVYRGSANPQLVGRYVFADFGSGRLWSIPIDTPPTLRVTGGSSTGLAIAAFGEGVDGELYVVDYGGTINVITQQEGSNDTIPALLSQTGCATASAPATPVAGMVPYAPAAPFWSDNASKERYLALPDGTQVTVGADGDFDLPRRSVLVKHFRLGSRLVETRLFMRHPDGVWAGYTYEWNAAGTDATRVIGGKTVAIDGQSWTFPSEAECLQCHTAAAGYSLGLETAQLNVPLTYPATGRKANQLSTLNALGVLTPPPDPATQPHLVDPYGSEGTLEQRARAYLHVNCSQCHRPGTGATDMDLRWSTLLAQTRACNVPPVAGELGLAGAKRIVPGASASSLVVARMNRRGEGQMPPLASHVVDSAGVTLVSQWIDSLQGCGS